MFPEGSRQLPSMVSREYGLVAGLVAGVAAAAMAILRDNLWGGDRVGRRCSAPSPRAPGLEEHRAAGRGARLPRRPRHQGRPGAREAQPPLNHQLNPSGHQRVQNYYKVQP